VRRVAYVGAGGEIVELAPEDAERVLERDPALGREWQKWDAMSGGRGGRLVVLDGDRVKALLAREGDGGTT
jgi:hypothetical protein